MIIQLEKEKFLIDGMESNLVESLELTYYHGEGSAITITIIGQEDAPIEIDIENIILLSGDNVFETLKLDAVEDRVRELAYPK